VIDIGPEGGAVGGQLIAEGTPEQLTSSSSSNPKMLLKDILA